MKIIQVRVKPKSRVSILDEPDADGIWLARLKPPPVGGKANEELIALVARRFACSKSAVSIKSGATSRMKRVQIKES